MHTESAAVDEQKNQHNGQYAPDNQQHRQSRHSPPRSRNEPVPAGGIGSFHHTWGLSPSYYRLAKAGRANNLCRLAKVGERPWLRPRVEVSHLTRSGKGYSRQLLAEG